VLRRLRIAIAESSDYKINVIEEWYGVRYFFHKTTATTRTVYFSKIRRIGFRRNGTEPL